MTYILYNLLFISLLPFNKTADYSHQSYYDIIRNNKVIGYMVCSKIERNETIEYINESTAKFSVLIDVSVYSKLQSSFSKEMLLTGKMIRQVNGKTKADKYISWNQGQYAISNDGKQGSFSSKINFSTACLMYAEPVGMAQIFSENFGKNITIKEITPHKYALQLPDGSNNFYTYSNGKCVEVEVQTSLATVYLKPRK